MGYPFLGWKLITHHYTSWYLPLGVLKLNFDGSDIICNHDGAILHNYLVNVSYANKTEVYSLLICCRELNLLSEFKAVIEGDSKLAIL